MTWTLVHKPATVTQASAGTVTGTLPGASTAGNLLVAFLGSGNGGNVFTGPTGWLQGPQVGNGSVSRVEIWYYPGNPGGISSASFTSGTGGVRCVLAEFSTSVAGATVSLDFSGSGTAGAVNNVTATATAGTGDLACCVGLEHLGSPTSVTWTDPSGFTVAASMPSGNNVTYAGYDLTPAAGSLSATVTSSVTATGPNAWTGALATFKATSAATQTIFIGACVSAGVGAYTGMSDEQAELAFASFTGRPVQVRRSYFTPGKFPIVNGKVQLSQVDIAPSIAAGRKVIVSFKPAFNPVSQDDYDAIVQTLTAYQAAGLNGEVGLWHEPSNPGDNLSPAQYGALHAFYASAVTPFFPLVAIETYWSAAGDPQNATDYFNACAPGTFAKGYLDFYCRMWSKGATLDGMAAACDAQGIPFGLAEWGCSITNDGLATCQAYFTYVTNFFQARRTLGTASDLVWFNDGPTGLQIQAIPVNANGTDPRIPFYQTMFDTLTSSGSGTVTVGASLTVTATPSATLTGATVTPVTQPPQTPGFMAGFPQIIAQIGVSPAIPVAGPTVFLLSDPDQGILNLDTLAAATAWADVSAYVRSGTITRTSTRQNAPVISYDAGTLSAVLRNDDGRFDPDNTAATAPYAVNGVTQLRPMTPIRVTAAWAGVQYPLYSGFADSWITADTNFGNLYSEITVSATDAFKVLTGFQLAGTVADINQSGDNISLPVGGGEDTGARITRLLDYAGWDNNARQIDTGNTDLLGTSLTGPDALTEAQLSVDSELGELYCNGSGDVVFRRRHGILEDARSTGVQAVFGDNPGPGSQLNTNPGFEGGTDTGWALANGATDVVSGAAAYTGSFGLTLIPGVSASASLITSPNSGITPGQYVIFSAWLKTLTRSWPMKLILRFFNGGGTQVGADQTTTLQTTTMFNQAMVSGFAPAGAVTCNGRIVFQGTPPPSGFNIAIDEAYLTVSPELPYANLGRANDETQLCNDAQITASGSSNLQEAMDADSVATFLYPRSYARSDLLLESDAEALSYAQYIVFVSKGAEDRFDTITLNPLRDPGDLFPQALGREIGDRIAVIRRPPGMAPVIKELFIRGITHTVDISSATWQTQWQLQDASRYSFLTLGDPVTGELNQNGLAH